MEDYNNKSVPMLSSSQAVSRLSEEGNARFREFIVLSMRKVKFDESTEKAALIYESLKEDFSEMSIVHVAEAIRRGVKHEYGDVYRFEYATICRWIKEYMKTAPYVDVDDWFLRARKMTLAQYAEKHKHDYNELRVAQEKFFNENIKN